MSAEEALLGALNEEASRCDRPMSTSPASAQVLRRRFDDISRGGELRRTELEVAVQMSHKFDDKLRDVSDRLDEIASNVESQCELPDDHQVEEVQQHIVRQKVSF